MNTSVVNTFSCPTSAKRIVEIRIIDDLIKLSREKTNATMQFIGEGSNVVLPDYFDGAYIINKLETFAPIVKRLKHDKVLVTYSGSMPWHDCVKFSVINGFWGGENLASIPGLASSAPVQNIGAYGVELKDLNPRVWGIDLTRPHYSKEAAIKKLTVKDANYSYRNSIFKNELKNKFFITQIALEFRLRPNPKLYYQDLQDFFEKQATSPTLQKIMEAVVKIRSNKLPDVLEEPNAGSCFKNPIVKKQEFHRLKKTITALDEFHIDVNNQTMFKISAAQVINHCGLQGYTHSGGAQISSKHSLVVSNPKKVTGDKILNLVKHIQKVVAQELGLHLELELEVVN